RNWSMKQLPLPLRVVRLIGIAVCAFLLVSVWRANYLKHGVKAQSNLSKETNERARIYLRTAVASGNEAALQKVETDFPNTEDAALAHLLRGYLRLQAKDYVNAIALLSDASIATNSALGDYALYQRAQAFQESHQNEQAEKTFRLLAKTYPTSLLA